jgi:hypothetical protein
MAVVVSEDGRQRVEYKPGCTAVSHPVLDAN